MQNNMSTIIYSVLFILFLIFVVEKNLISFKFTKRKTKELLPKGSIVYVKIKKTEDEYSSLPFEVIKEGTILSITEEGYIVRLGVLNYLVDFENVYLKD